MENVIRTVSSKKGPINATNRSNLIISKMNEKGFRAIEFQRFSEVTTKSGEEIKQYYVSILFEKP